MEKKFYVFAICKLILLLSTEAKETSKKASDFFLEKDHALTFLKRVRRSARSMDLARYEDECVEEHMCSTEELDEMGLPYGKESFNILGKRFPYFFCQTRAKWPKKVASHDQCDGDNDCGNNYDEKYCRLDKKYKNRSFNNSEIRNGTSLRGGKTKYEGNVYLFGKPICDDSWNENDAKVACRSLGFSTATLPIPTTNSYFGRTSDEFILDDVKCDGYEDNLGTCADYVTVDDCDGDEGAGVKCIDGYSVELRGGNSTSFGNVFISSGPICDDSWGNNEAKVICNSLGFSTETIALGKSHNLWDSKSNNFILNQVMCKGMEKNIMECQYETEPHCASFKKAGAVCFDPNSIKIKSNGSIAAIDDNVLVIGIWGKNESHVLCNQIYGEKFENHFVPLYETFNEEIIFESPTKKTVLSHVSCKGNEVGIHKCEYDVSVMTIHKINTPRVFCATCNQKYLIKVLTGLVFTEDLRSQYQMVTHALSSMRKFCRSWDCKADSRNRYDEYCKVHDFLENFKALVSIDKKKGNIVVLNTKIDYIAQLQHHFLKEKFSEVIDKIGDVDSHITSAEIELGNYFENLANFESNKLNIDIEKILKSKDTINKNLIEKFDLLSRQLKDIVKYASSTISLDEIELSADIMLETISIIWNIFRFQNPSIVMKMLRQTSNALVKEEAESVKLKSIVKNLIPEVKNLIANLLLKFESNFNIYKVLYNFFRSVSSKAFTFEESKVFLEIYEKLEPTIETMKIIKLEETLSYVVENICNIIKGTSSITGALSYKVESALQLCYELKLNVRKIMTRFKDISKDDNNLIQAFANLAKAKIRQHSALVLSKLLKKKDSNRIDNLIKKYKAYLMLQEQKRSLIEQSCNYITYLNNGNEEVFCKNLIDNPNLDISELISYKMNEDMCDSKVIDNVRVVSIPSYSEQSIKKEIPASETNGAIDLDKLMKPKNGSFKIEANFVFKIPNIKWLYENGWITYSNINGPVFLKKFELFLPPKSTKYQYSVESSLTMINSELNNISYLFANNLTVGCQYFENYYDIIDCKDRLVPYHTDNCHPDLYPVCVNMPGDFKGPLYPLVTSSWLLTVKSKVSLHRLFPATLFHLRARVQLCYKMPTLLSQSYYTVLDTNTEQSKKSLTCCSNNSYYNEQILVKNEGKNPCTECPNGSTSRLNGLFCEKCPIDSTPLTDQLFGCEKNSSGAKASKPKPDNGFIIQVADNQHRQSYSAKSYLTVKSNILLVFCLIWGIILLTN